MKRPPDISIVIPAYNEAQRLPRTLERVRDWVERKRAVSGLEIEILVVDDGSTDETASVVAAWQDRVEGLRLVPNGANRGKGYSVRHGMREAQGRIALFTDADLSAPIEEADKLLAALDDADVAIGSRAVDRRLIETHQSAARETAGRIFNAVVQLMTGVRFLDTQCGFKAFRMKRARVIFGQQRIEDFGFDPELLFLARRHGLAAIEVPVRWAHDPGSKVHMVRDSLRMFWDLVKVRANALLGRYPRRAG
ncbi:MAG TPA: dolichyl-phosphate beta-glucosyltransferase [Candidatus Dormibacteraeota bacterium]|nr:dolichyl-phosphate beta-glucosyltransferase [Candidatus Dormibacteraeota bacterium]